MGFGETAFTVTDEQAKKSLKSHFEDVQAFEQEISALASRTYGTRRSAWALIRELAKAGGKPLHDDRVYTYDHDTGTVVDKGPSKFGMAAYEDVS